MKILFDTHLLIWFVAASERLPSAARNLIEDVENTLIFSAASIWELAIKQSTGKAALKLPPKLLRMQLLEADFGELPVTSTHGLAIEALPPIHKDPFDRIMIAQAISENMLLVTCDETVAQYSARSGSCASSRTDRHPRRSG